MNTINIIHPHDLDKSNACNTAELMLEDIANKYGLNIQTDGDGNISFEGSGITGHVTISQENIEINATLGFLMTAMKTVISNEIQNKLEERFS